MNFLITNVNNRYVQIACFNQICYSPQQSREGIIGMHFVRPSVCPSFSNISCQLYNLRTHWWITI